MCAAQPREIPFVSKFYLPCCKSDRLLETKPVGIVSDEIREVVERYLPELKHKLPPKIDVLPSVRRGWLN